MADDRFKEMEEKKVVAAVLLDLNSAFDILDHKLLPNKLSCYGFESSAWIKRYLTDRKYMYICMQSILLYICIYSAHTCRILQGSKRRIKVN